MEYGICTLSVIPMRAEGSERSEQVSQLLFGEAYEILNWHEQWVYIRTAIERYEGWIGRLQVTVLRYMDYLSLIDKPAAITYRAVTQAWKLSDNSVIYLPATSSLAFLSGTECSINQDKYKIIGEPGNDFINISDTAKSYLNTPYQWGGRTHFGIDCSGFTQAVFRMHKVKLFRDASQQVTQGTPVDASGRAQAGDLAFFNNADGKITHVGILLSADSIIHASGRVKIDHFDSKGIYSYELKRYTHQLHSIKRHNLKL